MIDDSLLTSAGALTISRSAQNGLITGSTLGVVTDTRGYSTFGELSSYTANVSGSPVFSTSFTRDKLGRITQKGASSRFYTTAGSYCICATARFSPAASVSGPDRMRSPISTI